MVPEYSEILFPVDLHSSDDLEAEIEAKYHVVRKVERVVIVAENTKEGNQNLNRVNDYGTTTAMAKGEKLMKREKRRLELQSVNKGRY